MHFELILIFIAGGLFAGFSAGLFGTGGGTLLIPLFLFLLPKLNVSPDQVMHQAIATSLAIIVPSAFAASLKQYKLKNLDVAMLRNWLPYVTIGAAGTSFVFTTISSNVLQITFIIYLLLCAIYLFFKKPSTNNTSNGIPIPFYSRSIGGLVVGIFSVLLGVGGGTITVPYFVYYQYPLKKAIAISSATGFFVGLLGSLFAIYSGFNEPGLARYSLGYVNYLSLFLLAPFCITAATYGARASNAIPEKYLNKLFILFLICIAGYMYTKFS